MKFDKPRATPARTQRFLCTKIVLAVPSVLSNTLAKNRMTRYNAAVALSNRFSKDKTYVNVIMSDNLEAMQEFRDFLAVHHITNVAADSYTLDWSKKSITITAYAETKAQSKLIDDYIVNSSLKFKRVISKS